MMATSHILFGAACWTAVCAASGKPLGLEVGAAVLGAMLPDIDHPRSKLGRLVPFISWPMAAVFGHRGVTHSLFAIVAMAAVAVFFGLQHAMVLALAVGYLSHLVGDWLTGGIPLFWPMERKFAAPVTFPTDSIIEPVAVAGLLVGLMYLAGIDHFTDLARLVTAGV